MTREEFIRDWMPSIHENHSRREFAEAVDDLLMSEIGADRVENGTAITAHAVAEEREACAQICDILAGLAQSTLAPLVASGMRAAALDLAASIRARGKAVGP